MPQFKKLVRIIVPRHLRNWLRAPSKSVKWAWAALKFGVGIKQVVEIRPGWTLQCHPAAYGFAYRSQDSDDEQVEEFDGFISSCVPDMVLFDIGAHFGLFSFAALHYGGPGAKAIAVDPSTTATRMMRLQADLNDVGPRLNIVQAAVGERTDWQEMVTVGVMSGGYLVAASKDHPASEVTRTPATTLDKLAEEFGTLPTHIKIDVEGFEREVLKGGHNVLTQKKSPVLFLELHNQMICDSGRRPEDTLTLLKEFNYDMYALDGSPITNDDILSKPLVRVVARRNQI